MRLRTQFLAQLAGAGLSGFAFFALTPLYISKLGLERYGTLLLVLGLLVYAGVAELGMGSATSREIAAKDAADQARVFGTSLQLIACFALVGGVLFSLLSFPAIARAFIHSPTIVSELQQSRIALFLLGAVSIIAGVPSGALLGRSRFIELNVVNILGVLGGIVAPALYATWISTSLVGLISVVALAQGLTVLAAIGLCISGGLRPDFHFHGEIARTLFKYGGWSSASSFLHRLTNSIDRILISSLLGAAAVPIFAIPQGALGRTQIISGALMSSAFPRIARYPEDQRVVRRCYNSLFLLSPAFVVGIGLLNLLLTRWLGATFAHAALTTSAALALWAWLEILGSVPYALLQARSHLHLETKIGAIILIPNLIFLVISLYWFGVFGAAAVAALRSGAYLALRVRATQPEVVVSAKIALHTLAVLIASTTWLVEQSAGLTFLLMAVSAMMALLLNVRTVVDIFRDR